MDPSQKFDRAFAALPEVIQKSKPYCALILGSGWSGAIADLGRTIAETDYRNIPGLGNGRVAGHEGRLALIEKNDAAVLVFSGRRHWYECAEWGPVILPVEMARRLRVPSILVTNASGALNPNLNPGDLMIVKDHINLFGMNPLQGGYTPKWGPRFPDLSRLYSPVLSDMMRSTIRGLALPAREGIYAFVSGPCFETPAEVKMLRAAGADAVGMSTVPECLLAGAIGMRICALSCIANKAAGLQSVRLSHEEVLRGTRRNETVFRSVLSEFLDKLRNEGIPDRDTRDCGS